MTHPIGVGVWRVTFEPWRCVLVAQRFARVRTDGFANREVARYLSTMSATARSDKYSRYRDRQRAKGLKEVRMWLPDPAAPGFKEEVARQAALLRNAPEEIEIMNFVDAVGADLERSIQEEEDRYHAEQARKAV